MIKSRRMRWEGYVACMGKIGHAENILGGKPGVTKLLGKPRCRWEDNIRMDLRKIGWEGVNWMHLAKDWDQ
jgi:hypothetical protein